jgi:dTDP-4-dehydrorhamnose reductase
MSLVIFGFGYSAQRFQRDFGARHAPITATVRSPDRAVGLCSPACHVLAFDGVDGPELKEAIETAQFLLISIPPGEAGDPVLSAYGEQIAHSPGIKKIVYLSTVGVYGDHGGSWVAETTPCRPANARSRWRLDAEEGWLDLGARSGKAVHVLRLAGIYGPGQNALVNLRAGTARRIVKPGQVFNRIHVADIARAIAACFETDHAGGVWNVSDDEPAPPQDVITFAADLLGIDPPQALDFDSADLSPMARSFYGDCKRVSNAALKRELGVALLYPTYREALRALAREGDGGTK